MPSPETVFIINPRAGGGSAARQWPRIAARARSTLGRFKIVESHASGEAGALAAAEVAEGARRLLVVGGDGTLNEVINAIMPLERALREKLRLGIVPIGSGCDFARSLAIPKDIGEALALIEAMPVRSIDVGRIVFQDAMGKKSQRFFVNMVSFGLGGEVARQAQNAPRSLGPTFAFLWATLISVLCYGKKRVRLQIDGSAPSTGNFWNVAVANGGYHGGGMLVAPNARPDDGIFHITVIGDLPLNRVFLNLRHLYDGRIHQVEGVSGFVGTRVEAVSDPAALLDVDGEGPGTLPAVLTLVPKAIPLIARDCPNRHP